MKCLHFSTRSVIRFQNVPRLTLRFRPSLRGSLSSLRSTNHDLSTNLQPNLMEIFSAVSEGRLSPVDAAQTIQETVTEVSPAVMMETSFPEVIHGEGKRYDVLSQRMIELSEKQGTVVVTGVEPIDYAHLRKTIPGVQYHAGAKILKWEKNPQPTRKLPGCVGILQDASVQSSEIEEFRFLTDYFGCYSFTTTALSVSKISDIVRQMNKMNDATVIVVLYKDEKSLPDVVGGLTDAPVISINVGQQIPFLPTESLSVPQKGILLAARSVAKILKAADKLLSRQQSPQHQIESVEDIDGEIQGTFELLDEHESSLNETSQSEEEETRIQAVNNVVVNECREAEAISETTH